MGCASVTEEVCSVSLKSGFIRLHKDIEMCSSVSQCMFMFCDNVWTRLLTERIKKGATYKGIGYFHLYPRANKQRQNKIL